MSRTALSLRVTAPPLLTAIACALIVAGPAAAATGDADNGRSLAEVCAACHGPLGNSADPNTPNLAGQGAAYLLKQLQDIRDNRRPVPLMAGQLNGMSDSELADMAAWYAGQNPQITGARNLSNDNYGLDAPAMLALGERIYRAGVPERGVPACAACHSPAGLGNNPAGWPHLGGQHATYTAAQLRAFRNWERKNDGDSLMMRSAVENLRDLEIEAVSNYIAGLTP